MKIAFFSFYISYPEDDLNSIEKKNNKIEEDVNNSSKNEVEGLHDKTTITKRYDKYFENLPTFHDKLKSISKMYKP